MRETGRGALAGLTVGTTDYGFERSLLGGVHLLAAVAGFAIAAGALAATRRWWSGIAMLGVLAGVCLLAVALEEPARRWHLARGFERLGVPLVAPDVSGHRLFAVEAPIVGQPGEPVIMLDYRRDSAETLGEWRLGFQVTVHRGSVTTAAEACATPEPWEDGSGSCRAASLDRWVRHGSQGRIAVFTHRGDALVELESYGAEETTLLAAGETIRPISAEALAEQVRPVR